MQRRGDTTVVVFWVFTNLDDSIPSGVDGVVNGSPSNRDLMMALGKAELSARGRDCRDTPLSSRYLFISSSEFLVWLLGSILLVK